MASTAASSDQLVALYREFLDCYTQIPVGPEGFAEEQKAKLRAHVRDKTVLLLAFPPKCGGTFLREVLGTYLELRGLTSGRPQLLRGSFMGGGDHERDLYFPELLTHFIGLDHPCAVLHNHPTATNGNLALMELFGLKPVVMERSIPDMLLSLYDAAEHSGRIGAFGSACGEDESFFEQPLDVRKDFLIHNVAPWYVKFYASWHLAALRGQVAEILWVSYEDFRRDPAAVAAEILGFHGIEADP
ncbi:MAG: hypothetical protein O7B99_06605 [Planctomycetota bacterium]|nr:hypothetical protein [Planctomycetota bacterium]